MARRLTVLENLTPSTALVPVRKFACANVLYLVLDIANDRYRVSWSAGAIDRFWAGSGRRHPDVERELRALRRR